MKNKSFFFMRSTYYVHEKRDREKEIWFDVKKEGYMRKACMHATSALVDRVVGFAFFSTRFGRCGSCSLLTYGCISLLFIFFYFGPLKSTMVGMACVWWVFPTQGNFASHSVVGFGHQPFLLLFASFFFFSSGSLASLVRYHGGIPHHQYKQALDRQH